ncbi:thioredoxin family protein [Neptunomonas antarctica]|uniref:Small redox-active disulfide protein 2 n=1 Tax=Neptunomonas antarctica TaxID=619304 RepID=A0A1N7M5I9_9GAMM|nr:thioredoxin family protein [Neptunomonas antarctica]SIS81358.1 small redox-active disulfide protein 2 [Neptunomonas antarctica]
MKTIKVLGSGCTKCQKTAEMISRIAAESAIEVSVIKVTDPAVMMEYGVMSTPAVVVDEQLMHSGSIPHRADVEAWLVKA